MFSTPDVAEEHVLTCVSRGVHAVVGTTGWTAEALDRVQGALRRAPSLGVLVAPNFALGAVLLMRFAAQAAAHYESVEIIELHHPDKVDAPSGTARHTAELVAASRQAAGLPPGGPDATVTALDGARGARRRGRAGALGAPARARGARGGPARRAGGAADAAARLVRPGLVHAGRAARRSAGWRTARA